MRALFWLIVIVLAVIAMFREGGFAVVLALLFFGWLLAGFLKK